jgi:hypothetical protein
MNRQFFLPVEVSANMAHNLETADDTFMLSLRSADYRVQPQIRRVRSRPFREVRSDAIGCVSLRRLFFNFADGRLPSGQLRSLIGDGKS